MEKLRGELLYRCPAAQGSYNESLPAAMTLATKPGPRLIESARRRKPNPVPAPVLLVTLEPWRRVFLQNLKELFWSERQPPLRLVSRPAPFWPDVFVVSRWPWGKFAQSMLGHVGVVAALVASAQFWPQPARLVERPVFHSSDVIVYQAAE